MDAVEFLKEKERMCREHDCFDCPLGKKNNERELGCPALENQYPETAIAIVEQWSREHPIKTRQSEFLKMFPNAKLDQNGYVLIQPCHIEASQRNLEMCDRMPSCTDCRKAYWFAEGE